MSNSKLVSYTRLSPNHSGKRRHAIDTISIHCMAGNLSVESCGRLFADRSREASSNYGIGSDGRIALYVDEGNRSWCTSSASRGQSRRKPTGASSICWWTSASGITSLNCGGREIKTS